MICGRSQLVKYGAAGGSAGCWRSAAVGQRLVDVAVRRTCARGECSALLVHVRAAPGRGGPSPLLGWQDERVERGRVRDHPGEQRRLPRLQHRGARRPGQVRRRRVAARAERLVRARRRRRSRAPCRSTRARPTRSRTRRCRSRSSSGTRVRIFVRGPSRVSWYASAASRSFSKIVRLFSSLSTFLTNCSAIVDAPWVAPPVTSDSERARDARGCRRPGRSRSACPRPRRSRGPSPGRSAATCRCTSWFGGAKIPIGRPWSSYRYELAVCPVLRRCSRSGAGRRRPPSSSRTRSRRTRARRGTPGSAAAGACAPAACGGRSCRCHRRRLVARASTATRHDRAGVRRRTGSARRAARPASGCRRRRRSCDRIVRLRPAAAAGRPVGPQDEE